MSTTATCTPYPTTAAARPSPPAATWLPPLAVSVSGGPARWFGPTTAVEVGSSPVFDVTLTNPRTDASFKDIYPEMATLVVGDEEYDVTANPWIEIKPEDSLETQFVYQVPTGTDLSKASLVVQEFAGDPKDERIPATLNVDGTADEVTEPVEWKVDKTSLTDQTYCGRNGLVTIDRVVVTDRLGESEAGETLGVVGQATNYQVGLGQARDGEKLVTVYFNDRLTHDGDKLGISGCGTEIGPGGITAEDTDGAPMQPIFGHNEASGIPLWNEQPNHREAVFTIPEDQDSLKLTWGKHGTNGGEAGTITASAS